MLNPVVLVVNLDIHVVDAALNAVPVLGADAHEAHVVAHGAVDGPGVHVEIAQLPGHPPSDGALPRPGRAVNGDGNKLVHMYNLL